MWEDVCGGRELPPPPHRVDRINALWKLTEDSERWINEWSINANFRNIYTRTLGWLYETDQWATLECWPQGGDWQMTEPHLMPLRLLAHQLHFVWVQPFRISNQQVSSCGSWECEGHIFRRTIHIPDGGKLIPQRTFKNAEFNSF